MNYPANTYHFRQDSSFLYFFGINRPGFYGVCDADEGRDTLYGDDFGIDDIIWMGEQPAVSELAARVGADTSASTADLSSFLKNCRAVGPENTYASHLPGRPGIQLWQLLPGVDHEGF